MIVHSDDVTQKITFWQFFRLIFVVFSLYLTGDAFFRYDGFSYYASLYEFIPAVALIFILWSIIALIATVVLWLVFSSIIWAGSQFNRMVIMDHALLNAGLFVIFGAMFWKAKKILWPEIQTAFSVKLAVLLSAVLLSMYFTWLLHDKASRLIEAVLKRVTPLVWIFGALLLISVPVVSYHTWFMGADNIAEKAPSGSQENRPNIILVTFDGLAAGEMSLYGYPEITTPFISNWAANSTVFAMVESGSNFTTPAVASLMTGKRVWTHQTYHIAGSKPMNSALESLPAVLKENGYYNLAFVVNPFASVDVLGISESFDIAPLASEFGASNTLFGWKFGIVDRMLYRMFAGKIREYNWILKNEFILSRAINLISRNIAETPVPPEKAFNVFLNNLDAGLPEPFFAWIHVFPPHDPYLPPERFFEKDTDGSLRSYKAQEKLIEESYKYLFEYKRFPEEIQPAVALMRDYYDEFIRYCDKQFEEFIGKLDARAIENTLIILSADHGESFDHGYFTHGGPFLYEQVTHIPLIIKEPGQQKGQVLDSLFEQVDLTASILDLIHIPVPEWMDGRSFVPMMRGYAIPRRPVFSMNLEGNRSRGHEITTGTIALWEDDYKLIHYLENGGSLLFNLSQDPEELSNIFSKESLVAQHMLKLIKANLEDANKNIKKGN